ncbi:hypothetical protein EYF80_063154 [Liparis tanakae]|uniref:Uncharacterized protein n=1 Tax=Liparis tanakae TaxID=230148 RepID=A0A4Z2ECZ4_9TELE|nr:hypothetical protein EYF80_063154 [Liparis tanakae]
MATCGGGANGVNGVNGVNRVNGVNGVNGVNRVNGVNPPPYLRAVRADPVQRSGGAVQEVEDLQEVLVPNAPGPVHQEHQHARRRSPSLAAGTVGGGVVRGGVVGLGVGAGSAHREPEGWRRSSAPRRREPVTPHAFAHEASRVRSLAVAAGPSLPSGSWAETLISCGVSGARPLKQWRFAPPLSFVSCFWPPATRRRVSTGANRGYTALN